MPKLIRRILFGIALVYAGTCVVLATQQQRLLYYPTPEVTRSDAQALLLNSDGVKVKLWKINSNSRHAIIYFGGNAEDVSRNIPRFSEILSGYDFYLVNYRGYGGSEGVPSEGALYADALAVFDFIQDDYDNISVIGRSLGSGVATFLASERKVDHLALITPYDSIENIAQAKFPILPVRFLLKDKYDSAGRAHKVSAPTLIIVAEHDGVIPRRHSDKLASKFKNAPVEHVIIEGSNHLSVSNSVDFWEAISDFFYQEQAEQRQLAT